MNSQDYYDECDDIDSLIRDIRQQDFNEVKEKEKEKEEDLNEIIGMMSNTCIDNQKNWNDLCESYCNCDYYINFYERHKYFPLENVNNYSQPFNTFLMVEYDLKKLYYSDVFNPNLIVGTDDVQENRIINIIVKDLENTIENLYLITIGQLNDHYEIYKSLLLNRKLTKNIIIYSKISLRNCGDKGHYPSPFDEFSDIEEEFDADHYEYY